MKDGWLSGPGLGFLDSRYLKLDTSNDPITGNLMVGDGVTVANITYTTNSYPIITDGYVAFNVAEDTFFQFNASNNQIAMGNALLKLQNGPAAGKNAILDIANVATSDKTFTFPNATGTFALLEVANVFTANQHIGNGFGLVVGHTAQIDFGATPELQVLGTAVPDSSMGFGLFANDALGADFRFLKSRGATIGSNVLVVDGDRLGRIRFQGADGNDFNTTAAELQVEVDGTASLNNVFGRFIWNTRSSGGLSEKMRLTSDGLLGIGVTPTSGMLEINAATATNEALILKTTDDNTTNRLFQTKDSSGNERAYIDAVGRAAFNIQNTSGPGLSVKRQLFVDTGSSSDIGLVVKGRASQTANLQEWQESDATVRFSVGATGGLIANSSITGGTEAVNFQSGAFVVKGNGNIDLTPATQVIISGGNLRFDNATAILFLDAGGTARTLFTLDANDDIISGGTAIDDYRISVGSLSSAVVIKDTTGNVGIGGSIEATAQLDVVTNSSSKIALIVKGASSQTANIQEWQNSSAGVVHATGDGLAGSEWVHNEGGIDIDFRVEGLNETSLLHVDASTDRIGIGTATPFGKLDVVGDNTGEQVLTVRGASGQTTNIFVVEDDAFELLASIGDDGSFQNIATKLPGINTNRTDPDTNGIKSVAIFKRDTSGTPADGIGGSFSLAAQTSAASGQPVAEITWEWATVNQATRIGQVKFGVVDSNATRDALIIKADGAQPILSIGGVAVQASTTLLIQPGDASYVPLIIKGASSQSANLAEWQDSSGTPLLSVTGTGVLDHDYISSDVTNTNTAHDLDIIYNAGATTITQFLKGFDCFLVLNGSGGTSGIGRPIGFSTTVDNRQSSGTVGVMQGANFNAINRGAGAINESFGQTMATAVHGTGNINVAHGILVSPPTFTSSGVITTMKAIEIRNQGNAVITTATALNILDQSGATTNFAIRTNAGNIVFNEGGDASTDFRVESSNYDALFIDGGNDSIDIMHNAAGKIAFFAVTPVVRQTELTDELTTITHTAAGTPDFVVQDLVDSGVGSAFGFATKDEGNTVLSVIVNLQARVNELETKLTAYGLLQDAD